LPYWKGEDQKKSRFARKHGAANLWYTARSSIREEKRYSFQGLTRSKGGARSGPGRREEDYSELDQKLQFIRRKHHLPKEAVKRRM